MLIFIVPTSYPNKDNPVANSFIEEQAIALSKIPGNKVVVLNVQKQPSSYLFKHIDKRIEHTEKGAISIVHMKHKTLLEKRLILSNQCAFDKDMKKLYKYAVDKYGKPDVIYAHFYSAAYSSLKMEKNVPIVVLEHSAELMQNKLDFRYRCILKKVVKLCDRYLATTDNLKNKVMQHTGYIKEVEVLPNIIDEQFTYHPILKEDSEFKYFALSRMEFDKRLDLLIESFCDAHLGNKDVLLYIGGNGKEYANLQRLIAKKQCSEQVKLLGRIDRPEVLEQMKRCSCFVLPSRHETFGLVWREALCVGRPVITTNHGGFGETDWSGNYGVMVDVDNKAQLTDAITYVYQNYNTYDLEEISSDNQRRYSAKSIMDALMNIFNTCLGQYHKGEI